ncbi:MAG: glycosyltransferase family 39 protein, partial [Candidatus Omnitrophica bacterium]|nr:glycosyltransferase family 39 protein [Candidatus Omnitrophota bacterium]
MKKNFLLLTTLGIILILGGFLRFVNLSSRGIFSWDEGHYTGVLYTLHAAIRYIINTFIFGKDLGEFSEYMLTYGINHYLAGKPTFFVLGLIATLFSGLHIYTLQLVSALTGLLTIAVIYYISCALGQKQIGIIAAFMLAISYFHIYYSRTALPQISSVFFAYSAVLFYIYAMRKDKLATENFCYNKFLLLAGLTIGFAFSSHYNLFWMPFVFWFSEILHYSTNLKGKPFGLKLRRFLIFSFFMALPLLGYELFLRAIKIYIYYHPQWITAISGSSGQGEFLTYFEQLKTQISQSKHFSDTANALSNKLF